MPATKSAKSTNSTKSKARIDIRINPGILERTKNFLQLVDNEVSDEAEEQALSILSGYTRRLYDAYVAGARRVFWSPLDGQALWCLLEANAFTYSASMRAIDDLDACEKWIGSGAKTQEEVEVMQRLLFILSFMFKCSKVKEFREGLRGIIDAFTPAQRDFALTLFGDCADCLRMKSKDAKKMLATETQRRNNQANTATDVPDFYRLSVAEIVSDARGYIPIERKAALGRLLCAIQQVNERKQELVGASVSADVVEGAKAPSAEEMRSLVEAAEVVAQADAPTPAAQVGPTALAAPVPAHSCQPQTAPVVAVPPVAALPPAVVASSEPSEPVAVQKTTPQPKNEKQASKAGQSTTDTSEKQPRRRRASKKHKESRGKPSQELFARAAVRAPKTDK